MFEEEERPPYLRLALKREAIVRDRKRDFDRILGCEMPDDEWRRHGLQYEGG
jgi:hypothetical protein